MSVFILGSARTPVGSFLGGLSSLKASVLGGAAIKEAVKRSNIDPSKVDEVIMGQVVQAGSGQAPARQATIFSGLSESVPATTINKVCGSGMKALIMGAQTIKAGDNKLVVTGGMENMSLAPHLLPSGRAGVKFGEAKIQDSMQWDGLWDVYSDQPMGNCAELCAEKYGITREEMDEYAKTSFMRAQKAQADGIFASEIIPVEIEGRKGPIVISEDEGPSKVRFDKIPNLKPAFKKGGTITAANASSINDGGASIVLGGEDYADQAKFKILSYASHAHAPEWFTTAPIEATKKCLDKAGLKIKDIDLFEINEAFAVVALASIKELELEVSKVNIYGSAISLGHPIGVSGARIIMSLMSGLKKEQKRYGLASICIGGGEALSVIIERMK